MGSGRGPLMSAIKTPTIQYAVTHFLEFTLVSIKRPHVTTIFQQSENDEREGHYGMRTYHKNQRHKALFTFIRQIKYK
jgi:hypothetical protein